ncbi:MAG: hypothetical protein L6V93_17760 [Clostridiales bacterium]|nr:MAG: hypothetical protein L6V93_17760 [Clostridiales bacterium]
MGSEKYFCGENEKNFEDGFVPFYANSKKFILRIFVLRKNFGIDVKDGRFLSINGEKNSSCPTAIFVSADGALLVSLEKLADALGLAHYFDKNGVFLLCRQTTEQTRKRRRNTNNIFEKNTSFRTIFFGQTHLAEKSPRAGAFSTGEQARTREILRFRNSEIPRKAYI